MILLGCHKECLYWCYGAICLMIQLLGCGTDDCLLCRSEFLGHCRKPSSCNMIGVGNSAVLVPEWGRGEWLCSTEDSWSAAFRVSGRLFYSGSSLAYLIIWSWKMPGAISNLAPVQYAPPRCIVGDCKEISENSPPSPKMSQQRYRSLMS